MLASRADASSPGSAREVNPWEAGSTAVVLYIIFDDAGQCAPYSVEEVRPL